MPRIMVAESAILKARLWGADQDMKHPLSLLLGNWHPTHLLPAGNGGGNRPWAKVSTGTSVLLPRALSGAGALTSCLAALQSPLKLSMVPLHCSPSGPEAIRATRVPGCSALHSTQPAQHVRLPPGAGVPAPSRVPLLPLPGAATPASASLPVPACAWLCLPFPHPAG